MPTQKQISSSTLTSTQTLQEMEINKSINVHRVGTVEAILEGEQAGLVRVTLWDLQESETELDVSFITFPPITCMWLSPKGVIGSLAVGDLVLVGFNDRSLSNVIDEAPQQPFKSPAIHDLSDGVILGVLQNRVQPNEAQTGFSLGGSEVTVGEAGITINSGESLISIKNDEANLKEILTTQLTAISTFATTAAANAETLPAVIGVPSPMNPAFIAAFTDLATATEDTITTISELLE